MFVVPFVFIVLTAPKDRAEASRLDFSLPDEWHHLWENIVEVVEPRDYMLVTALHQQLILTVGQRDAHRGRVGAMVGLRAAAPARPRWTPFVNCLVLAGLIIPPAVVPTI